MSSILQTTQVWQLASKSVNNHWTGANWAIDFDGEKFIINSSGKTQAIFASAEKPIFINRKRFRKFLVHQNSIILRVSGISKFDSLSLVYAQEIDYSLAWFRSFSEVVLNARLTQRWIPQEVINEFLSGQQKIVKMSRSGRKRFLVVLNKIEPQVVDAIRCDIATHIAEINEMIIQQELITQADFLARI